MVVALGFVLVALRKGLELRRRRHRGERRGRAMIDAHAAVAKPAVVLVAIGLVGGPASALLLRDWTPMRTFHGWIGLLAAALFLSTGWIGWQLAHGRSRSVDTHAWLALGAVLVTAVAAVAGFVLLP